MKAIIFNSKECGITKEQMKILYRNNLIECNDFTFTVATIPNWAIEEAKNLVGHSNVNTILAIYAHLDSENEQLTEKINKIFYI